MKIHSVLSSGPSRLLTGLLLSSIASLLLCAAPPVFAATDKPAATAGHNDAGGIGWRKDNDVDAAFALAKASKKPVFLYWGAVWCPPCNQVKATIFNRQDFIDRSRHFIPVYLDGDTPSAQKLAARFKVRGYPTMILFKPDGAEITRLPGEVDAERYLQVLVSAMNSSLSVQDSLKLALTGSKKVSVEDWSLLADYSWDDPEQKLVNNKDVAITLFRLAELCPAGPNATRLYLKALSVSANTPPAQAGIDKAAALDRLIKALADPRLARDNMDVVTSVPGELLEYLSTPKTDARGKLMVAMNAALLQLADDTTLSKTDRLAAVNGLATLAKLDNAKPDASFLKDVQKRIVQIEQATTDAYERQSVVNAAAHAYGSAGLLDESDNLLKAELKRSHSPYYFMSSLASNAKKRGDKAAAVNWYEQAYNAAKGPATRLQWGSSYVSGLTELAPTEDARIEKAAQSVLAEIGTTENAFYERNRAYLDRMGKKLLEWNKDGKHQASFQKVRTQLDGICAKLPASDPQRAACQSVLSNAKS
ncbi:thioredoxin fold domain-containing protein [Undibacterium sp. Jales W-56]|uniref:thioredoxin family protein n=1 Tax=Undibacterium sp. Jales W-56 TaxID=2897325 RepID=UPI0021D25E57|nr:thioredoxin fold domain-containing protein [Undibacterium sp. Jales W-56]MCU6435469.1 thioredoxin fold domain-containing protein [Undibacterium sp. Jales W-56]